MGFVLESRDASGSFELSDLELDEDGNAAYVKVRIVDSGLAASARLTLNTYQNDALQLSNLFRELARDWKGWQGRKEWKALESPFQLAFTHDGLGHITAEVTLGSGFYRDAWSVTAHFILEAGSLERLAQQLARFLRTSQPG